MKVVDSLRVVVGLILFLSHPLDSNLRVKCAALDFQGLELTVQLGDPSAVQLNGLVEVVDLVIKLLHHFSRLLLQLGFFLLGGLLVPFNFIELFFQLGVVFTQLVVLPLVVREELRNLLPHLLLVRLQVFVYHIKECFYIVIHPVLHAFLEFLVHLDYALIFELHIRKIFIRPLHRGILHLAGVFKNLVLVCVAVLPQITLQFGDVLEVVVLDLS